MAQQQTDAYRETSDPIYSELHESEDFRLLRSKYRGFAIPWTIAFLVWYLLYVVMSNWAGDFMDVKIVGHINVALLFGILQFVTTFLIAFLYARHSKTELDPLANKIRARYDEEKGGTR